MLVHRRVTPSIKFADTHLSSLVERGTVWIKLAPSWCRRYRIHVCHNTTPTRVHVPIVFVFLVFLSFVPYCFTSTVSSTPSRSHEVSCPRIQPNVPGQDSKLDHSIQRQTHQPWGHCISRHGNKDILRNNASFCWETKAALKVPLK